MKKLQKKVAPQAQLILRRAFLLFLQKVGLLVQKMHKKADQPVLKQKSKKYVMNVYFVR